MARTKTFVVEVSEPLASRFVNTNRIPAAPRVRPTCVRGLPLPTMTEPKSGAPAPPSDSLGLDVPAAASPAVPRGRVLELRRVKNQAIMARVVTQQELLNVNEGRLDVITPFSDDGIWQCTMTYHDQGLPYGAEKFLGSSGDALTSEVGYFMNINERCS